jgi:hypothetical protein
MKPRHLAAIAVATSFACAVWPGSVAAQATAPGPAKAVPSAKTPTQAFLDYDAAVRKAKTLAEVLPYLSAEYRAMLESRPKADQPVWLGRLKESPVKDLKVTKETVTGNKCTLEATGTSEKGNAVHGKIILVKEDGAWKLDEQFWAT